MGHGVLTGPGPGVLVAARARAPPPKLEICLARVAAGVLLCLVSLVAAVLYGLSWENTGDRAKREDGVDLAMLIVFLAVPLGLAAVYVLCTCYLRCFLFLLCGAPEERQEERHDAFRQLRVVRRRAQV